MYPPARGCEPQLNAWCDAHCPLSAHGGLYARFDTNARLHEDAWRCYAYDALSADLSRYERGTAYCTRHAQLRAVLEECVAQRGDAASGGAPAVVQAAVSPLGAAAAAADPAAADAPAGLVDWPATGEVVTMRAVDTAAFAPTPSRELHAVAAWRVDCVDDYQKHRLKNYTMNVSRKKAFLKRAGLACYGRCVRGVVDGFATHAEIDELRALTPEPSRGAADVGAASAIDHWRWAVPAAPAAFRTLVRRAQTVLDERFGVRHLRFYRSNIITWDGETGGVAEAAPARWQPRSLHGDTNTDEMFQYTTILYLSQHGEDVAGAETGIADAVSWASGEVTAGLRVEPSVGRLLVFSAGVENMHEMLELVRGRRVAIQMWFACEGMEPGWADGQRALWHAERGYGGPDGRAAHARAPPEAATKIDAPPWPWRG